LLNKVCITPSDETDGKKKGKENREKRIGKEDERVEELKNDIPFNFEIVYLRDRLR